MNNRVEAGAWTVSDALVARLTEAGVDVVFGLPGVHNLGLYRALARSSLRHVAVRHEQASSFMADGYARLSGRIGVAVVIGGPGLTNAATGIAQAYSDSVPVLILTSTVALADIGQERGSLHDVKDQALLAAQIAGRSVTARSGKEALRALDRALADIATGRPRPAVIGIPHDVMDAPFEGASVTGPPIVAPVSPEDLVARSAAIIADASSPIVVAGGGALGAAAEFAALVEATGIPVVTTVAAKGLLPPGHPCDLGSGLSRGEIRRAIGAADVVLAVGTELGESDLFLTADHEAAGLSSEAPIHGRLGARGALIRVDIDPGVLTAGEPTAVAILGDAKAVLERLRDTVPVVDSEVRTARLAAVKGLMAQRREGLTPLERKHVLVLDTLSEAMGLDGVVVSDMTQIGYTGCTHYRAPRPRSWLFPMGYGTMGYALPAAIGAKVSSPNRPVAALVGDGGFLFTVPELATAVELGLPLPILLWNNDALGEIADFMRARGIPEIGVRPRNPDFLALARAFGAEARRPDSLGALAETISDALSQPGPTLIEVREDAPFLDWPKR
jgi:5-guanidino-2-oxopentanoate decarboxylase